MRKLILILFVILISSCGSFINVTSPPVQNTYNIDKSKKEIYLLSNEWMVKTFNNAESVIEFQDKESGKIIGKYAFYTKYKSDFDKQLIYCVINLSIKEGAIKIDITPSGSFRYVDSPNDGYFKYSSADAERDINALCEDLRLYLENNSSDW